MQQNHIEFTKQLPEANKEYKKNMKKLNKFRVKNPKLIRISEAVFTPLKIEAIRKQLTLGEYTERLLKQGLEPKDSTPDTSYTEVNNEQHGQSN